LKASNWTPASLENNFQIPSNPPLLKGGEGGFSLFAGVEPGMENFAGETNIRKAWFFVVIPAEAGIQDALKNMKSSLDNFGLIGNSL